MNSTTRYLVYLPDQWVVGYHTTLGDKNARSWAIHTACRYGGQIIEQFKDGTERVFRDYSH